MSEQRVVDENTSTAPADAVVLAQPLGGTDGQLMVMAAHRYCLGRRSYIVGACLDWLRRWWDEFERNTQRVILRDTVESLQDGTAGDAMDARGWTEFAQWACSVMGAEDVKWAKDAVAHRGRTWPL